MIWIVAADVSICRIYRYNRKDSNLELIKEISHPEDKLKTSELISDQAGQYQKMHSARSTYSPHLSPKEVEVEKFVKEIANVLNHARTENEYNKLYIFTGPHLNGLLKSNLNPHIIPLIEEIVNKDITKLKNHELLAFVEKYVK